MLRGLPALRETLLDEAKEAKAISLLAEGVLLDPLRELLEKALEEELPAEIKVDVKGQEGQSFAKGMIRILIVCGRWQRAVSGGLQSLKAVSEKAPEFRISRLNTTVRSDILLR